MDGWPLPFITFIPYPPPSLPHLPSVTFIAKKQSLQGMELAFDRSTLVCAVQAVVHEQTMAMDSDEYDDDDTGSDAEDTQTSASKRQRAEVVPP